MEKNRENEFHAEEGCEGTLIEVLKVACEELFPKFVEAGPDRCARYVGRFLLNTLMPKTKRRRSRRR